MSSGGCSQGIYGGTPAEILHAIQLRMCVCVAESLEKFFTKSCLDMISNAVVGMCDDSHRQSERDLPGLGPFRHGLMSLASMKTTERFARVHCLSLALNNSYLIDAILHKKEKIETNW